MNLTWNLVSKHVYPHAQLQNKFREKITKLERHLQHFPPEAVHLHISLERQLKRPVFTAGLTLRLPSNILRSAKSAGDPVPAFDAAVKALLRELGKLKSELRRENQWARVDGKKIVPLEKPLRFTPAPLPQGKGPQDFKDVARQLVAEQYPRLLNYIERQLERAINNGDLSNSGVDAQAVADESIKQALANPEEKPADMGFRFWLYFLASRDIRRRERLFARESKDLVSLEQTEAQETADEKEAEEEEDRPVNAGGKKTPRKNAGTRLIPDTHASQPDEELDHKDFVDYLHRMIADWPVKDRQVFELHFIEEFTLGEIAMIEKMRIPEVSELIGSIQARLRKIISFAAVQKN
jgi:ribosomal subunit interface protein